MKIYITIPFLFFLISETSILTGQDFGTASECITNPPNLANLSYEQADEAINSEIASIVVKKTRKICPQYITNLVHELRQHELNSDKKILGFYLLGFLRPTETNAIEVLIENIDIKASRIDPAFGIARWGDYPACEALIRVGKPCSIPLLQHLRIEPKELRRVLMCAVLRNVEGKDVAQKQVKDALTNESDPTKRANLEAALKELEK